MIRLILNILITVTPFTLIASPLMGPGSALAGSPHVLHLKSAIENADFTEATLPLFQGTSRGKVVWYVITDSSDRDDAESRQINYAPKLTNVKGTPAVQRARYINGVLEFGATVDFSPVRSLVPSATGFPPLSGSAGSIGEPGYSPFVELPDGTVLNAPHVSDGSLLHDNIRAVDFINHTVTLREEEGFHKKRPMYYISFDAATPIVAAFDGATWAPNLNAAPGLGSNDRDSARSGIIPFANGQTGVSNPERQGLNSTLLGEGDPLNIVETIPRNGNHPRYSPLWDVHTAQWIEDAVASEINTRQTDFRRVVKLVRKGLITGVGGTPWGAIGVAFNCPVISSGE